jgi:hypothetical protein
MRPPWTRLSALRWVTAIPGSVSVVLGPRLVQQCRGRKQAFLALAAALLAIVRELSAA